MCDRPKRFPRSILRVSDVCRPGRPSRRHRLARSAFEQILARRDFKNDIPTLEAVNRTVPETAADYEPKLFTFARTLRFSRDCPTASHGIHAFQLWFFLAQPARPGLWYERAERKFRRAFEAAGTDPLKWVDRIARKVMCSWWKSPRRRITAFLGAVARFIPSPFLSLRVIERGAKVDRETVRRHMKKLAADGTVRVVRKGTPHAARRLATVYDLSPLLAVKTHAESRVKVRFNPVFGPIAVTPPTPFDPADGPPDGGEMFLWQHFGPVRPNDAPEASPAPGESEKSPDRPPRGDP